MTENEYIGWTTNAILHRLVELQGAIEAYKVMRTVASNEISEHEKAIKRIHATLETRAVE